MAISVMARMLGKRPPTEVELKRMESNTMRLNTVYQAANITPIITHTVYEDKDIMSSAVEIAVSNGILLDEYKIVKYDITNVQFASRLNTTVMLSSPAVKYNSDMLSYNKGKFGITDEEIEQHEHYHNSIDYGIDSIGKNVDSSEMEIPDLNEAMNIAYNSALLDYALMQDIDLT